MQPPRSDFKRKQIRIIPVLTNNFKEFNSPIGKYSVTHKRCYRGNGQKYLQTWNIKNFDLLVFATRFGNILWYVYIVYEITRLDYSIVVNGVNK